MWNNNNNNNNFVASCQYLILITQVFPKAWKIFQDFSRLKRFMDFLLTPGLRSWWFVVLHELWEEYMFVCKGMMSYQISFYLWWRLGVISLHIFFFFFILFFLFLRFPFSPFSFTFFALFIFLSFLIFMTLILYLLLLLHSKSLIQNKIKKNKDFLNRNLHS